MNKCKRKNGLTVKAKNTDVLDLLRAGYELAQPCLLRSGHNKFKWNPVFTFIAINRRVAIYAIRALEKQGLIKIIQKEDKRVAILVENDDFS